MLNLTFFFENRFSKIALVDIIIIQQNQNKSTAVFVTYFVAFYRFIFPTDEDSIPEF